MLRICLSFVLMRVSCSVSGTCVCSRRWLLVWLPSLGGRYPASSLAIAGFREPSLVRALVGRLFSHRTPLLGYCRFDPRRLRQGLCSSGIDPDSPGWRQDLCAAQCGLRLRCSGWPWSIAVHPRRLRPQTGDRLQAQHGPFRSFGSDSARHASLRCTCLRRAFRPFASTTGWVTSPYPGGVDPARSWPIARLIV
jgi:hypothetical protein